MIIPKLRELGEAIVSLFSKPYTSKYPFTKKPYEPVPEFRGKPKYDEDGCVGCGACAQVCPADAIEMIDIPEEEKRIMQVSYTNCIYCGQCEEHCITQKGIKLSTEYITAVFSPDREADYMQVEKKLIVCPVCGTKIATEDHMDWLIEKLGPKAYGNPNLLAYIQLRYQELPETKIKNNKLRREDYYKLMCPHCRHQVVVEDAF
ncbi:MAG TPA: 4Fe-4S dicluster domain-containing protein [Candidatus Cloacimonetes bacterium]|nr:4Fe-4S dicluster domain-containing protein [Candidatus Cloacimonadota bacterium]HEX38098.1 4Fe-4S dicluster domain-containing protein [Candidatus Cloacimonadota bacterium]